jgi:hypothetical protein
VIAESQGRDGEVRHFSHHPRTALARAKVTVSPVTASLDGPASAMSGAKIELPGKYLVRLLGAPGRSQSATVRPNATTNVNF